MPQLADWPCGSPARAPRHELRPDVGRVVRFCLATGQRVGEVVGMTATELGPDRRVWRIPVEHSKNGHPHSVPLSPLALEIIAECTAGEFDGWGVSRNVVSYIVWRYQLLSKQWQAHELRRTALTKMAQLGVAPIVIGHVANHRNTTKAGVTLGVYVDEAHQLPHMQRSPIFTVLALCLLNLRKSWLLDLMPVPKLIRDPNGYATFVDLVRVMRTSSLADNGGRGRLI
jgi:integrase